MNDSRPSRETDVPSRLLLDFDKADVITPMIEPPRPVLVVSGVKPYKAMEVSLVPLAYAQMPRFWEFQVVGVAGDLNVPTQLPADPSTPYSVEIDLAGLTGTVGIEVSGAGHNQRIEVTSG